MGGKVKIVIVGVGKIARHQHIPALHADPDFELVGSVTHHDVIPGVPNFSSLTALKAALPDVSAVSICTPPLGRLAIVREALSLGLSVMIEKPPAGTLSEAEALVACAAGGVLFVTWHSRWAPAVELARTWLTARTIRAVKVTWKEDVRVWHPGQEWIWAPGIGVFDPGINALSILTHILPGPLLLDRATLWFPVNRAAPIAAQLSLGTSSGAPIDASFDFDQRGLQSWDIVIETDEGRLELTEGGTRLLIDGTAMAVTEADEYPRLYRRFAELIATGASETDLAPFRIVADAFMLGERREAKPFDWSD